MEEGSVDFIAVDEDGVLTGEGDDCFEDGARDYGAGGVLGVAAGINVTIYDP
jgi:hypothetical protein